MFARNMNLYAINSEGEPVFSLQAKRKLDYFCMECGSVVRLRDGEERHPHFYHLAKTKQCRQNGKSRAHLEVQLFIERALQGEVLLEHRFPSINRIADVAWPAKKLIFEVQCSPLTKDECTARIKDYASLGYQVVWILHDRRYNQWRVSALERYLMGLMDIPHYFTNIDHEGKGCIYDQWAFKDRGIRKSALPPLPVDVSMPYFNERKLGFKGDFGSLEEDDPYLMKAEEKELALKKKGEFWSWKELLNKVKEMGNSFLANLLKPHCD